MTDSKSVLLAYVGDKPVKRDTVTSTKTRWLGYGDVQPVPEAKAKLFLRFPDVWILASDFKSPTETAVTTEQIDEIAVVEGEEGPASETAAITAPSDESTDAAAPEVSLEAILAGLKAANNPEDFTATGKPKVDVVRRLYGKTVAAKEIEAAWVAVSEG